MTRINNVRITVAAMMSARLTETAGERVSVTTKMISDKINKGNNMIIIFSSL